MAEIVLQPTAEKPFRPINSLAGQRILSIDTFRGITILVMIFVNEVAGVDQIPQWLKHMPADADAMTFVDMVFPAFLFIVGMSIPFAINHRLSKGDTWWQLQGHILFRTLGLLVLGVFMVNTEGGYNEAAMGMSIHIWSLCFYVAAILVWNVYRNKALGTILRGIGVSSLVLLALVYRGGDGTEYMKPQWWGILGLIGWAYLYTCVIYQLVRGNVLFLIASVGVCTGVYMIGQTDAAQTSFWEQWTASQAGNAAHTSIALCGVVVSLLLFGQTTNKPLPRRLTETGVFAVGLVIVGFILRPYYTISKIQATPTWCFYSAAACCVLFVLLYWLIDRKGQKQWTAFFQTAAANPLLTYIIPYILAALFQYTGFYPVPDSIRVGLPGVVWAAVYAVVILWLVKGLNRLHIRLQL